MLFITLLQCHGRCCCVAVMFVTAWWSWEVFLLVLHLHCCSQVFLFSRSSTDWTSADPGHIGMQLPWRLVGGILCFTCVLPLLLEFNAFFCIVLLCTTNCYWSYMIFIGERWCLTCVAERWGAAKRYARVKLVFCSFCSSCVWSVLKLGQGS